MNKLKFFILSVWFFIAFSTYLFSQNMLKDAGFESSLPNGTWPTSLAWERCWYGTNSGGVVVSTYHHNGSNGLYLYTDSNPGNYYVCPKQDTTAAACNYYEAGVYVFPINWIAGSVFTIEITFYDININMISQQKKQWSNLSTAQWHQLVFTTQPAPALTKSVQYKVIMEKPNISGQTIAVIDDCWLNSVNNPPRIEVNPKFLNFGADNDTMFARILNTGIGSAIWNISTLGSSSWLRNVSPLSGILGDCQSQYVRFIVSRSSLKKDSFYSTNLTVTQSGGNSINLPLMLSVNDSVPNVPSIVRVIGRQLLVQKRMPCGILTNPFPYIIKGFNWSPASIATTSIKSSRQEAMYKWASYDFGLIKGCNANTIRVYMDCGTNVLKYKPVLDKLYKNGMMVIMTVDDAVNDINNLRLIVNLYKNHPAILFWSIGNEWNINLYYGKYSNIMTSADSTESAARLIKSLDANHPVATCYGDLTVPSLPGTGTIVYSTCPSIDIWGLNIYRGSSFGQLWSQWNSISSKPVYISEFGTDAFNTSLINWPNIYGSIDEAIQRDWNHNLWIEIVANLTSSDTSKSCLGGTFFEWNDEWWKVNPTGQQDKGGWNGPFPDNYGNEEYFGTVSIDSNYRTPRLTYYKVMEDFKDSLKADFVACDTFACTNEFIRFYDNSSGNITQRIWFFGDGLTSTAQNPMHSYKNPGTYAVNLIISSNNGGRDSIRKYIYVRPQPVPSFIVNPSDTCLRRNNFIFRNNSTISSGSFSNIWQFGDSNSDTAKNTNHHYSIPDTYTVRLIITSNFECDSTVSKNVIVHPQPIADFNINDSSQCFSGNNFIFTDATTISSGSHTVFWDLGDGTTSTLSIVNYNYFIPDTTFKVKLIATSGQGCSDSIMKKVYIFYLPNTDFVINDSNQCLGGNIFIFNALDLSVDSWHWDFGNSSTSTQADDTMTYASAGTYTVKLVVSTNEGCSDSMLKNVQVYPQPVDSFSMVYGADGQVTFTPNAGINHNYLWKFGDGDTSTQITPTHKYSANGNYPVIIELTSIYGCKTTGQDTAKVRNSIGTEEFSFNANNVKIYPNPTKGLISIEIYNPNHEEFTVSLYDMTGKLLSSKKNSRNETVIKENMDISIHAKGMYIFKINTGRKLIYYKVTLY